MHEQSFEKQVQQKMDELSLTPSAPVWQKVEERIRKKKERRRVLFWALPLLLAGGAAYWFLSGTGSINTPLSSAPVRQHQAPVPERAPAAPARSKQSLSGTHITDETTHLTLPDTKPVQNNQTTAPAATQKNVIHYPTQVAKPGKKPLQHKTAAPIMDNKVSTIEDAVAQKETASPPTMTPDTATVVQTRATNTTEDTQATVGTATATKQEAADTTATTPAPPATPAKKSKWSFAVHAEAGVTSIQSGLIPLPATRDAFASPTLNTGGSSFLGTTPLLMQNGPSFAAGFTARKDVNGRTRLTAGLQYTYYATESSVGQKVTADTVFRYSNRTLKVGTHYRPGSQNEYTNSFHFVQVPIGLEYRLLKKAPFYIHSGVTLAKLIHSNALLYDYNLNVYYKNSAAFQKTQLHLFTNVTYTLWKRNNKEINLGPYAQYGLTEPQKGGGEKNRLFSGGLRTQLSF